MLMCVYLYATEKERALMSFVLKKSEIEAGEYHIDDIYDIEKSRVDAFYIKKTAK